MSLGFSLKDFLTVTDLISTISSSLKNAGSSPSDFQELVRELDLLQRALTDIEHLTGPPSELPSINAIKCAALNCQYVLDEFSRKLRKFEKSLGNGRGDSSSTPIAGSTSISTDQHQGGKRKRFLGKAGEKLNDIVKKVEWEIFMKEDVRDLRAYLTSHVGSLNLRMITQGLSTASIAAKKADDNRTMLEQKLEELRGGIKLEFKAQELILKKTNTLLDKVIDIVNDEIAPQLKAHGTCNVQILDIVKSLQTRIPDPDIRFTWFQDPCRLEDARGHRLPIPSEFGYELVRAIIKELFKTGPGHRFVRAGDYQLSNIKNSNHLILGSKESSLTPGMSIRMAILLSKVNTGRGKCCPMPHCGSDSFVDAAGGGHTCSDCGVWFAEACKLEKRPQIHDVTDSSGDERRVKRVRKSLKAPAISPSWEEDSQLDLAAIKNIRIPGTINHATASLPPTTAQSESVQTAQPIFSENRPKPYERIVQQSNADDPWAAPSQKSATKPPQYKRNAENSSSNKVLGHQAILDDSDVTEVAVAGRSQRRQQNSFGVPKLVSMKNARGGNDGRPRSESLARGLVQSMDWGGLSGDDWSRDDITSGTSPFPNAWPSYLYSSDVLKQVANFMRDFKCCGQTLPTLHDLLQHYDDAHAREVEQRQQRSRFSQLRRSSSPPPTWTQDIKQAELELPRQKLKNPVRQENYSTVNYYDYSDGLREAARADPTMLDQIPDHMLQYPPPSLLETIYDATRPPAGPSSGRLFTENLPPLSMAYDEEASSAHESRLRRTKNYTHTTSSAVHKQVGDMSEPATSESLSGHKRSNAEVLRSARVEDSTEGHTVNRDANLRNHGPDHRREYSRPVNPDSGRGSYVDHNFGRLNPL